MSKKNSPLPSARRTRVEATDDPITPHLPGGDGSADTAASGDKAAKKTTTTAKKES